MPKTTYYSAHTQPNGLALTYTPKNAAEIIAAGALIWRVRNSKIELLIIHRPRYDDWSWPKGKQDAGETIPETAIREISEEVQLRVHLGVPLGTTRYKVNGKTKDVFYWAAQLPAWEPSRVLSSPWLRCVQTVAPYVNEYSLTVKEKKSLSEAGAERHPKRTAKTIASLFEKGTPALVCTHRPVLPVVLDAVAEHLLTKKQKEHLPAKDPYLEPGDILVLQVSAYERGGIVSAEVVRPFTD